MTRAPPCQSRATSGPYFQKQPWPPFVYQETVHDLAHLDEYQIQASDSRKVERRIAVTFSDHCFTRESNGRETPPRRTTLMVLARSGTFAWNGTAFPWDSPFT